MMNAKLDKHIFFTVCN